MATARAVLFVVFSASAASLALSARLTVSSAKRRAAATTAASASLSVNVTHFDVQDMDESGAAQGQKCCQIGSGLIQRKEYAFADWLGLVGRGESPWEFHATRSVDVGKQRVLCKQHAYFSKECTAKSYSWDDTETGEQMDFKLIISSTYAVAPEHCISAGFCSDLRFWAESGLAASNPKMLPPLFSPQPFVSTTEDGITVGSPTLASALQASSNQGETSASLVSERSTLSVSATHATDVMQYQRARGEKCCRISRGRLYWHKRVVGGYAPGFFDLGAGDHLCKQHAYFNRMCEAKEYSLVEAFGDHPKEAFNAGILHVTLDIEAFDTVDDTACSHGSISFCNDVDRWWPFVAQNSAAASALQADAKAEAAESASK